ncbi:MAG: hypothetical protein SGI91_02440 [Alphaproteobacteria bacterium]|nr:hypothetical protein [Alphaproteobacteria bacterium]
MSKKQWKKLSGFEAWNKELALLLDQAHAAADGNDDTARRAIARDLTDFVNASWPNDDAIKELDQIALATSNALLLQNIGDRVRELTARTGEYKRLTKDISGVTESIAETASALRMESITKAIQSTTAAVQSLKDLSAALGDAPTDKALAKKLTDAIDAIETLRTQVAAVI